MDNVCVKIKNICGHVENDMAGESDNFKRRLLSVLDRLDEDLELLERYIKEQAALPEAPTDNTEDGP